MDAAKPLFQSGRVPGQVVVDHQVAELEVDALAGGLGRDAYLPWMRKSPAPACARGDSCRRGSCTSMYPQRRGVA